MFWDTASTSLLFAYEIRPDFSLLFWVTIWALKKTCSETSHSQNIYFLFQNTPCTPIESLPPALTTLQGFTVLLLSCSVLPSYKVLLPRDIVLQNEKNLHPSSDSMPTFNQIKCEFQFIPLQCEGSDPIKMSAGIYA